MPQRWRWKMFELFSPFNGGHMLGFIVAGGALFYALLPGEAVSVLRGIGELFGIRKEES